MTVRLISAKVSPETFFQELSKAGLGQLSLCCIPEGVEVSDSVSDADYQSVVALVKAHDAVASLRKQAFETAMNYGNSITAQVESQYASVERASFTAQEAEAKAVLAGETLPDDSILTPVAQHKGVSIEDYAKSVLANAAAYRKIAVAAVILRRGADGLLSEDLDTVEKLEAAVQALKAQAKSFADDLGLQM